MQHWAQGGPTTLSNLVLLCRRHHRSVHEDGFQVERLADGDVQFRRPNGWILPEMPEPSAVPADAADALAAQNVAAGVRVDPGSLRPDWDGTRLNLGYAIDVLHPRAIGY